MELDARQLPLYLLVRVRWQDSSYQKGWWHPDEKSPVLPHIYSVGYVIRSTCDELELAGTMSLDGGRLNPLTIPADAIISVQGLKGI